MEIRVYDNQFNFIGIVEDHSSLLWHRMYNESGDFTLTTPITNLDKLKMGNIVWVRGKAEAGVIESVEININGFDHVATIKGRFLEAYLDRRLVNVDNYTGNVEQAMRSLITSVTPIPMIQLGEEHGFTETTTYQAVYKSLLWTETNLAKSAAFGFRLRPDFIEKTITFEIYKGVDHSINQYDNTKVVFSEEYGNLTRIRKYENDQLFYNVVTVGGKYEYEVEHEVRTEDEETGEITTDTITEKIEEDVYVTVGDTTSTGLLRRETFCDGSDVRSDNLSRSEFESALAAKGNSALGGHSKANSFECTVLPNGNFIYGKDYDLGDIVTVKKPDWGISANFRMAEVTEIYESEIPTVDVVLGTTLPQRIKWEG